MNITLNSYWISGTYIFPCRNWLAGRRSKVKQTASYKTGILEHSLHCRLINVTLRLDREAMDGYCDTDPIYLGQILLGQIDLVQFLSIVQNIPNFCGVLYLFYLHGLISWDTRVVECLKYVRRCECVHACVHLL